ncbi:MAG: D-2-hydroxyacid dehydrogenase [Clostridia bacterium]|nr:D-2-hydroxyacid dehydrogenase [Clostridia bacterium]
MKLTVLDGYTLNPGDNPWTEIEALGELTVYDRTPRDLVVKRAKGSTVLFTNKTPIGEAELAALPEVKLICVLATGYNIVDCAAAAKRGIPVCNVPSYGTDSVAELVFALVLNQAKNVSAHAKAVSDGAWSAQPDYSFWLSTQHELAGKTMGIVGFGRIGRRVGELANAFGMRVIAYAPRPKEAPDWKGFEFVSLEKLLSESDYVSLNCPLTSENAKMIGERELSLMKPGAYLINTARGQLIDSVALAKALEDGVISGAAVDVLDTEPPAPDNPLIGAKNITVTPHIAWATVEARQRLMRVAAENVKAWLAGNTQNRVN